MACFHIFQIYKPYSMYPSLGERRFQHYRDQPGFALTDYHPLAANWIVLTVHRGGKRLLRVAHWISLVCFPK